VLCVFVGEHVEINNILQGLSIILSALLAGSMLFFSFVMAPLIFIKLDIEEAGKLIRAVFPWYYLSSAVLSGSAGVLLLAATPINAILMLLTTLSFIYCRQILMPRINACRDRSKAGEECLSKIFDTLHRRSEILNTIQLIAVMAILFHLVFF
tara:strand:- start:1350 stop:1808 length:459 start_codon:yes stop_codon:yes gene_type:complete